MVSLFLAQAKPLDMKNKFDVTWLGWSCGLSARSAGADESRSPGGIRRRWTMVDDGSVIILTARAAASSRWSRALTVSFVYVCMYAESIVGCGPTVQHESSRCTTARLSGCITQWPEVSVYWKIESFGGHSEDRAGSVWVAYRPRTDQSTAGIVSRFMAGSGRGARNWSVAWNRWWRLFSSVALKSGNIFTPHTARTKGRVLKNLVTRQKFKNYTWDILYR